MYCRKCGHRINKQAKYCDFCGEEVIVIKKQVITNDDNHLDKDTNKRNIRNPYVYPAIGTAIIAFALAIFPWPHSWQIGTSLWLRIIILIVALLSDYHSTKAKQINNLYFHKYKYKVQPRLVTISTVLGTVTTVVALYSLFMI